MMEPPNIELITPVSKINESVSTLLLPQGALARFGRGVVEDVCFSPDGNRLAVASRIGVWLYDMSSMSPRFLWDTERGVIFAVAFSPTAKLLATGNWDGDVKVWDVENQQCISKMKRDGQFNAVSQLLFSPNGEYLVSSGGNYNVFYVWCPETGKQVTTFTVEKSPRAGPRPYIIPLAFSPNSALLTAATPENTISVWDIEASKCIACFKGHTEMVVAIAFSPCGRFIASGDRKGTLQQWHVSTAHQFETPVQYSKNAVIPSYTSEGVLRAAAIYKASITVWDVKRNKKLDAFDFHGEIDGRCFSNGTDLAVAGPSDFKVWRELNNAALTISGHTSYPKSLTFSPDTQTLASVGGGTVTCWNVATKQPRRICYAKANIRAFCITPDGSMLALGTDKENTTIVWNVETDQTITSLSGLQEHGSAAAISPTGKIAASAVKGGNIYVWDAIGKERVLIGHRDSIASMAFAPDEKRIATVARDTTARLWDVASGEEIISLPLTPPLHNTSSSSVALLASDIYKGDSDEIKAVLNAEKKLTRNTKIKAITFSPCGNLLAGGMEGGIRFWDVETYETRMVILLPRNHHRQFALAFSPCGQYLASGTWWWQTEKVSISLWDVATGENIATFYGHPTDIQYLAFSPDGTLLASGSFDGTILLWDMKPYLDHETL